MRLPIFTKSSQLLLLHLYYKNDKLVIKGEYNVLLAENEFSSYKTVIELKKVRWPKDNEKVGVVKVYLKDKLMHEENIYFEKEEESINKVSFWQKIWNFIKFWD